MRAFLSRPLVLGAAAAVFLVALALLAPGGSAPSRAAPLGAGLAGTAVADSFVRSGVVSATAGSAVLLPVGFDGEEVRRLLVRFDLSTIAGDALVEGATLSLHLASASLGGAPSVPISATMALSPWVESTVSWASQPAHGAPSVATHVLTSTGWYSWDVRPIVQAWVSGAPNYGVVLRTVTETITGTRTFHSREISCVVSPCFEPRLVVTFTGSTTTPTITPTATETRTPTVTRTPTRTPTPSSRNLSIRTLEVTQAIQCITEVAGAPADPACPENGLPLLKNKTLAVRMYLDLSGTSLPQPNVKGRLTSRPCGQPSGGVVHPPIWPTARVLPNQTLTETRAITSTSLTFLIDKAYLAGGCLDFVGEVNPTREIAEARYDDNTFELRGVQFHASKNLNIKFVRVDYYPGFPNPFDPPAHKKPSWSTIDSMVPVVAKLFPVDRVAWWKASKEVNITFFTVFKDFATKEAWWYVLTKLWTMKTATSDEAPDMHYYGLVHPSVPDGDIKGWGSDANWKVAAGVAGNGGILAHELGHNENRKHAPCGGPDGVDPNWPDDRYPKAQIMESGFDVDERVPRPWNEWEDVMAYCDKWITPYTYRALYGRFQSSLTAAAEGDPVDHLLVSGLVLDDGRVHLNDWYHQGAPLSAGPVAGQLAIVLQGADGRTLASRHVDPHTHLGAVGTGPFMALVPYHPETARVAIMRSGVEVAARQVSAGVPQVRLLAPNGGERIAAGDTLTVTWSASDPDGEGLRALVQFSRDGGLTWQALEADWEGTSLPIEAAQLPGSDRALIRVVVTDGINVGQDVSDAVFSIERKPPEAVIFTPDGTIVAPGAGLLLRGGAFDAEDGPLVEDALRWASDRDGELGGGEQVVVQLSPGVHVVSLTARDTDGGETTARVTIIVGETPSRTFVPVAPNHALPA
ncbi:MAG: hypothetical protein KatS3mg060_2217 [Dehalococcoidia bacterium]|nr:MAG: hypothetical protein KatS3mg060_2217 [Dehalococcoidia bacterium]